MKYKLKKAYLFTLMMILIGFSFTSVWFLYYTVGNGIVLIILITLVFDTVGIFFLSGAMKAYIQITDDSILNHNGQSNKFDIEIPLSGVVSVSFIPFVRIVKIHTNTTTLYIQYYTYTNGKELLKHLYTNVCKLDKNAIDENLYSFIKRKLL